MIRVLAIVAALASGGPAAAQEHPYVPLPSPVSATCPGGLCQADALGEFFAALGQNRPVDIVQFGDSHTAAGDIGRSMLWRLQQRFEGVSIRLNAHGVVGATLNGLASREPLFEAGEEGPDLVVIAYGTNEGFDDRLDLGAYERLLRAQIARVRTLSPASSILILGAPEAMRGDGGGACPGDIDRRWKEPPILTAVRDIQHQTAADEGVAFWDWRGRMGGACSAHVLTQGDQPLMRGDHVHFTFAGGDWIGALLAADLIAAHDGRGAR